MLLALIDAFPGAVALVERATARVVYANRALRDLVGDRALEGASTLGDLERGLCGDDRDQLLAGARTCTGEESFVRVVADGAQMGWYRARYSLLAQGFLSLHIDQLVVSSEPSSELKLAARLMNRYMDGLPDVMYVKDSAGCYLACSSGLATYLGLERSEIIGQNDARLYGDQQAGQFAVRDREVLESGRPVRQLDQGVDAQGRTRHFDTIKTPLVGTDGESLGVLGVSRDITDLKESRSAMKLLMVKAEQANTAKSEFIANMSHEIRTPMNGIIGMAGILGETELTSDQQEYLAVISRSAESLLAIVNDVLDFTNLVEGDMDLELMDFDLRNTTEDTAEMIAALVARKPIEVLLDIEPSIPLQVHGDPGRLRQILLSLGSNAVKFTQAGTVTIRCAVAARDGAQARIRFEVEDTGIGIAEGMRETIFAPFSQQDGSLTRQFGGTGLGLSISYQLTQVMGGELAYTSAIGQGTLFTLELPFPVVDHPRAVSNRVDSSLAGRRVIVVDDTETNRTVMERLLATELVAVTTAASAEEALQLMISAEHAGTPYEVALLDKQMPGMDGEQLGMAIRTTPELASTKLLMLASLGRRGDARRLKELGFNGYLTKPIRKDELISCVRLLLDQAAGGDLPGEFVTRHLTAEVNRQTVRVLVAEDNSVNQLVAVKMLEQQGAQTLAVANGLEALDVLERMPFDLVLMDVQMPEMDGLEATKQIRRPGSSVADHDIPIVGMTAQTSEVDRDRCLEAGMDEFILKPLTPTVIASLIRDHVLQQPSRVRSVPDEEPHAPTGEVHFDAEAVLSRVFGDTELAAELAQIFVDELPVQIREIREAIESSQPKRVASAAHRLKGTAFALAADRLAELASSVEETGRAGEADAMEFLLRIEQEAQMLLPQVESWRSVLSS